jgi:hypothetical protein
MTPIEVDLICDGSFNSMTVALCIFVAGMTAPGLSLAQCSNHGLHALLKKLQIMKLSQG